MRLRERGRWRRLVSVVIASAALSCVLVVHTGAFRSALNLGGDRAATQTARVLTVSLDHGLGAVVARGSVVARPSRLLSLYGKALTAWALLLALLVWVGFALLEISRRASRSRCLSTPTRGPPLLIAL